MKFHFILLANMYCTSCRTQCAENANYCSVCGTGTGEHALNNEINGESDATDDERFDEEGLIRYYFSKGMMYNEIIEFLRKYHDYSISYSTLLRRLKQYHLSKRNNLNDGKIVEARSRIQDIISGPGSVGGYRCIWHALELEGIRIPRIVVQEILRELDPEGTELRKARRLKRREYINPGPFFAWHMDGYDKLKPWGFPIHGCIDGFSRRILWLNVCRSNKSPSTPAAYYLETVRELGGCPVELISDLGTENGLTAAIHCYFRDNSDAHRYVPSTRNQRIECWWSHFSKSRAIWWRNLFKDMEYTGAINLASEMSKACLWQCFSGLIQDECNLIREHWNTHCIRKSRHNAASGRPDSLFFLPEIHGAKGDLMIPVSESEIECASTELLSEDICEYSQYIDYVMNEISAEKPSSWEDAYELYRQLMQIIEDVN